MFWQRIWNYLAGYVVIQVTGPAVEKFINMVLSRGIYLWDIVWVEENTLLLKVRVYAVFALRHIAHRTGSRFRIRARKGFPFWVKRFKKRKMLVAGAVFFVAMLYLYTSFIWSVEIKGLDKIPRAKVITAARQAGVKPGLWKWLFNKDTAKEQLTEALPEAAWVEIYIDGTKIIIEVVEKILPPPEESKGPAHIMASKDGLIKGILVLNGQAMVKEGDTVQQGQVLISGTVFSALEAPPDKKGEGKTVPGKVIYTRAKGVVKAAVWYEGYGEQRFNETIKTYTGRTRSFIYIKIGQKEIILKGSPLAPYKYYNKATEVKRLPEWRNLRVPVEVVTTVYREQRLSNQKLTPVEAKQKALDKALKQVEKVLPQTSPKIKPSVEIIHAGEEKFIRLRVVVQVEEEIGQTQSFEPPKEGGGLNPIDRRNGKENSAGPN